MKIILILFLILALPTYAKAIGIWDNVKTVKCTFTNSSVAKVKLEGFVPEIVEQKLEYIYDSVNLKKNSARLIGSLGAEDVTVISGTNTLSFVEITATGNINITSLYSKKIGKDYLASTSRHVSLEDFPLPSQLYGKCKNFN